MWKPTTTPSEDHTINQWVRREARHSSGGPMIYCSVTGNYGHGSFDKLGLQIVVQKGKDSLPARPTNRHTHRGTRGQSGRHSEWHPLFDTSAIFLHPTTHTRVHLQSGSLLFGCMKLLVFAQFLALPLSAAKSRCFHVP